MTRRLKRGHSRTEAQPMPFYGFAHMCESCTTLNGDTKNPGWILVNDGLWVQVRTCTLYDIPAWR